jgi:hypothetical protein
MIFHHIGLASVDAPREMELFETMGYVLEKSFTDTNLGIRGYFMVHKDLPRIEILENFESSVLQTWLKSGSPFYHFAIECPEDKFKQLKRFGREIIHTRDAVAFPTRNVSFVLFPGRKLIEFIY